MQDSYIYAAARVRSKENSLITGDRLRRMAQGSLDDAMRLLSEVGYGGAVSCSADNINAMIQEELSIARSFINEVTPNKAITDVFLMQTDITNLKLLIKLRCLTGNVKDGELLISGGVYEPSQLRNMVEHGSYDSLPPILCSALNELELKLYDNVDPRFISTELDKAYISYALTIRDEFVQQYFKTFCEYTNVIILLRARQIGANPTRILGFMLPSGSITAELLQKYAEAPLDTLGKTLLEHSFVRDGITKALEEVNHTGRIAALEKYRDNALMELTRQGRWESESILPLVGYLLARRQEAKAIRLVITLKRNAFNAEAITERLRELYV